MPLKLSTTIGKIQNIPNSKNIDIINDFHEYMRSNGSSEHHQNNNLKVVITFSNFVSATNYITIAERPLNPADFPTVPKEDLVRGSMVFNKRN
jgi:hypothetical protein